MKIIGLEGLSEEELQQELQNGAKLVYFEYCISVLVMTLSVLELLCQKSENAVVKGLPYTLISLIFGWWGFPFGPIYTIGALINNLSGGKNVTTEFLGVPAATSTEYGGSGNPIS
ncbi:MAG: hypothetical protein IPP57_27425 [Candidatus Obscuribacter sp.]|nr:hypothetical protein [Candidatus Obscuribacter sp.]